ncbi:MAG: hypothetical protein ACRCZE_00090 [Candidatus Altimarinota bacterium]
MENLELKKEVLKLVELSSMEEKEKVMWNVLVPSMIEAELVKFKAILEKEVNKMTELYMKVSNQNA